MRVPFFKMFMTSPFEGLQEHAEKVMECALAFQQAMECYFEDKCKTFEEFRQEVTQIESQADVIKRRIRGHIPKETMMPISNFLVFRYLREQDVFLMPWKIHSTGFPIEARKKFRRSLKRTLRFWWIQLLIPSKC